MECRECGFDNLEGTQYCQQCGEELRRTRSFMHSGRRMNDETRFSYLSSTEKLEVDSLENKADIMTEESV